MYPDWDILRMNVSEYILSAINFHRNVCGCYMLRINFSFTINVWCFCNIRTDNRCRIVNFFSFKYSHKLTYQNQEYLCPSFLLLVHFLSLFFLIHQIGKTNTFLKILPAKVIWVNVIWTNWILFTFLLGFNA